MAVKFDKEMLLKHRFWIMLGVSVVLTLVGMVALEFSEASGKDDMVKDLKAAATFKATENTATIEFIKKNADIAKKNEVEVWKKAYDPQAALFKWPKPIEDKYDFANGYFANEVKVLKLGEAGPKKAADPAKSWQEASKNWPADSAFLMHGAFVDQEEDWFTIKDRKGDVKKFFLTRRIANIQAEDLKPVPFHEMRKYADKKMLAVGYQRGKYFGDPLTINYESPLFTKSYKEQIFPILESVDPLDDKLNGVVQLKDWLYKKDSYPPEGQRFIRYVTKDWPRTGVAFDQEAWIAQEDLWIQTELYRMIRSANDSVSNFTPDFEGKNDQRKKPYKFHNSYFDLELILDEKDNLSLKIMNRLSRKQSIDLSFKILLSGSKGAKEELIKISGFPLMPKGTKDAGTKDRDYILQTIPKGKDERTGIYSVQQVLNWQTAAVKRIDQISIGSNDGSELSHSQRTFPVGLRPLDLKDLAARGEPGKGAPAGPPGKGTKGGSRPGASKGKAPPAIAKKGTPGSTAAPIPVGNTGLLPAVDLWTDRYVEVTDQARRLPVAVVLIVDQEHVDRVLTAFNNSNLRFLETQVLLNQYPGSLQPPAAEDKDAEPGTRPMFPSRPMRPKGPSGPDSMRPTEVAAGAAGADLETNMELVIYGIVTIYQRYPARPPLPPLDKTQ